MLVRAKSTITAYRNYIPVKIFIEGNLYECSKAEEYDNLYVVTNEQGKQSLFIPELFKSKFEVVKE